jgi:hypothetical protein
MWTSELLRPGDIIVHKSEIVMIWEIVETDRTSNVTKQTCTICSLTGYSNLHCFFTTKFIDFRYTPDFLPSEVELHSIKEGSRVFVVGVYVDGVLALD